MPRHRSHRPPRPDKKPHPTAPAEDCPIELAQTGILGNLRRSPPGLPWLWTLAAAALLLAGYQAVACLGPLTIGLWQDDAIYVATARALAEGQGYRHPYIPGQPWQTKYPILYPALLAPAWLVNPDYPANRAWLMLPTSLGAALLLVLFAVYWRRVFGWTGQCTLLVALLAAISPVIVSFTRFTMSEFVYGALAIGALLCLDVWGAAAPTAARRRAWVLAAALLIAAAVLTRSIGVSLGAAAVAILLLRRRWTDASLLAAVLAACLAPWWTWKVWAARANGPHQTATLESVELSYAAWRPRTADETFRVIGQNLIRTTYGLGALHLAVPREAVQAAMLQRGWRLVGLHALCYAVTLLILIGLAATLRYGLKTLHLYLAAYTALMLAWPFEPYRFLIPWTPAVYYGLFGGLFVVGAYLQKHLPPPVATTRAASAATVAACLAVAVPLVVETGRVLRSTESDYYMREMHFDWAELRALERWLKESSEPSDLIASPQPAGLYLSTGRRGYFFWPDRDPYALFYGADRRWADLFLIPSRSERLAAFADVSSNLHRTYADAGITWYVEHSGLSGTTAAIDRLISLHPQHFSLAWRTPGDTLRVYRFHPGRASE
jgi:hypothetical protein